MAKKQDTGMGELLELLKNHPHLIDAIGADTARVSRLLKSNAARRLVRGVDVSAAATPTLHVEVHDGSYTKIFKCLKRSN